MTDLTERLRKRVETETLCGNRTDRPLNHVNLMDEAATTLETLTQENARLRKALEGCEGIESGPNGRGGMRVVVHFPNGGDETALFHVLNSALAARKALGGGDE